MFERFSENAIKAVMAAQSGAVRTGHLQVGTEQLLVGLLIIDDVASRCLRGHSPELQRTSDAIMSMIEVTQGAVDANMPFSSRVREVFDLSWDEALRLGHRDIQTAHLLLGLLREGNGAGIQLLKDFAVDLLALREQIEDVMAGEISLHDLPSRQRTDAHKAMESALHGIRLAKMALITSHEFELAAWFREQETKLSEKIRQHKTLLKD